MIRPGAAQQQAEADGSPGERRECPQLSLSVRRSFEIDKGGNLIHESDYTSN
jgi:hypothetical protein